MRSPVASRHRDPVSETVAAERLRAHYAQIPAMAIAPTLGGLYTVWVLWGAVDNHVLVVGMSAVVLLSALRLLLYRHYFALPPAQAAARRWRVIAVVAAGVSGLVWGSAAPFLYPPLQPAYGVYLVVLLTLLPIVPVAALAAYMPAFYAYYFPCIAPFVVTLALRDSRAEQLAALLLVMMMAAMLTFARSYASTLAEAIRLRVQLAQQSRALEDAVRHKTRFIAAASHDLRQPVHAMGLFLESLRQQQAHSDAAPLIAHLDASLRNLRGMLTNMLDVSRLDAEVLGPQLQPVDLDALLRRLADEHAPLAARKQLDFRCRSRPAVVRSDPTLLERMLRNLLSNAIRYTRHGGIALVCRGGAGSLRVQVIDTGIGIAAVDLKAVFGEFHQLAPAAGGDEAQGLGLGLAIVQRMAGLLEHPLRLRSVRGRGSVFTLELVRAVVPEAAPGSAPAMPASEVWPEMPPAWVLIVDDDPAVGIAAAELLRQWGHRTTVCTSAAAALAAVGGPAGLPQLLIVDFRLGDESGLVVVERICASAGRPLPVILVTGDTAPARLREAYEAGHLLLHKPVDPQRLRACMAEVCAGLAAG